MIVTPVDTSGRLVEFYQHVPAGIRHADLRGGVTEVPWLRRFTTISPAQ
jgi:hypothetical protein